MNKPTQAQINAAVAFAQASENDPPGFVEATANALLAFGYGDAAARYYDILTCMRAISAELAPEKAAAVRAKLSTDPMAAISDFASTVQRVSALRAEGAAKASLADSTMPYGFTDQVARALTFAPVGVS